jgi:hypothetical protein
MDNLLEIASYVFEADSSTLVTGCCLKVCVKSHLSSI